MNNPLGASFFADGFQFELAQRAREQFVRPYQTLPRRSLWVGEGPVQKVEPAEVGAGAVVELGPKVVADGCGVWE